MKLKIKKDGLTGDNLKLVEMLEQRFEDLPDLMPKEELEGVRTAIKGLEHLSNDEIKELLGNSEKGFRAIIKAQGTEISKLKEQVEKTRPNEDLSIRAQVAAWQTRNKEKIASLLNGEKNVSLEPIAIRAVASPMTPANSLNGSAYLPKPQYEAGATEITRVQPTFWEYLPKGRTSSAAYVWVNKKNPQGAAGFIAPGVLKPGLSFELATEISNAKKIAASEKVAMELLNDIEGMTSFLEQELWYQVRQKANAELLTTGPLANATRPASIKNLSTGYTLANAVKTVNPNNWDVLRAVRAQITSGNLEGQVTCFVNPIDKANMDLTKAISQGQYLTAPNLDVIVVEDNNIPVGYFQAAILANYRVLMYEDYKVTFGWENDDFTKNLTTVLGEMRLHQFMKENHTGSFVYDSFDNVKAAIEQV